MGRKGQGIYNGEEEAACIFVFCAVPVLQPCVTVLQRFEAASMTTTFASLSRTWVSSFGPESRQMHLLGTSVKTQSLEQKVPEK